MKISLDPLKLHPFMEPLHEAIALIIVEGLKPEHFQDETLREEFLAEQTSEAFVMHRLGNWGDKYMGAKW
jgi:hypothetical protein